ncbi:hypothetical protein ACRE_087490 [Hapsidospora chrysogenum ATCC 11550]|uniref:Uncharacterized protein n=1 Tax=Hapsidospora chrysogenum (strain ATCC 11550 / CBS 779.69 / DSM 880 / IAM 14645 / JCM 23072 / IMI 49137) TaxID=857340 RepID=A0A086STX5_HAPC1|nr:hypothetical protein ACRE_087490 [Hapsidospora chrysogenum ATCC 11550]
MVAVLSKPSTGFKTSDVTVETAAIVVPHHEICKELFEPINKKTAFRVAAYHRFDQWLLFCEHMLVYLRYRSSSNKERLLNEISSMRFSSFSTRHRNAALFESSAMRTIAFVALTFLPETFIAALFSMSFSDYDSDAGWSVLCEFWLYWVIAIPVTVATACPSGGGSV